MGDAQFLKWIVSGPYSLGQNTTKVPGRSWSWISGQSAQLRKQKVWGNDHSGMAILLTADEITHCAFFFFKESGFTLFIPQASCSLSLPSFLLSLSPAHVLTPLSQPEEYVGKAIKEAILFIIMYLLDKLRASKFVHQTPMLIFSIGDSLVWYPKVSKTRFWGRKFQKWNVQGLFPSYGQGPSPIKKHGIFVSLHCHAGPHLGTRVPLRELDP